MSEEFLCRVSFAGVPHVLEYSSNTALAKLYPIAPEELCHLYWLLSSLTVAYTFSINGVQVSRNFSASSSVVPKNRLIYPATFYQTGYDQSTQTSYMVELDMTTAYFDEDDYSNVGLKLTFEESDNFNMINFCLSPISGLSNVSREFSFAGKTLTAYLNYNPQMVTSAVISSFEMSATYVNI